uniref:Uncharacterized protein n=1 Tax=Nelumbo nucifera TaxID=4432 RepID=A0A822XMK2_NELNU|nr:TPA_asm: hypothetical protein HUJ06_022970 [Nelumbo nucifera]
MSHLNCDLHIGREEEKNSIEKNKRKGKLNYEKQQMSHHRHHYV